MFEELGARGLLDERTLYVITADHSPHPGLGGDYARIVPPARQRRLERVPLIFVSRNLAPLQRLDSRRYASQIDLAPTILSLLGLASPASFVGRDILSAAHPGHAFGHYDQVLFVDSAERSLQFPLADSPAFRKWIENSQVDGSAR
jgi:phosphoglycerol transferase MdoB-like AlkP superfamily enzyme